MCCYEKRPFTNHRNLAECPRTTKPDISHRSGTVVFQDFLALEKLSCRVLSIVSSPVRLLLAFSHELKYLVKYRRDCHCLAFPTVECKLDE